MDKLKAWFKANKTIIIFFVIYLLITFVVAVLFHENWEDEAQAWLTARDCSPIEIIGRMKYEGHFLPWYFIIMPFAKLGLPFKTANLISWAICGISAWLMLKYLPCKKYKRILLIFTVPMIYLFPVIARCYCLIPLATILLIMFYKHRLNRPIPYLLSIILMANTHIYCFMFAFILGITFAIDWFKSRKQLKREQNQKLLIYTIATVVITAITFLPLIGSVGGVSNIDFDFSNINIKGFLIGNTADLVSHVSLFTPAWIFYVIIAVIASYLIVYRPSAALKIFLCLIWQFFILSFAFSTILPQRIFINFFIVLYFLILPKSPSIRVLPLWARVVFVIILTALVISSGHFLCEAMLFSFVVFAFLPYLTKKKPGLRIDYALRQIFCTTLLAAAIIFVIDGFLYIYNDIRFSYSDSYVASQYIKATLITENESYIFLTEQSPDINFTSIIAYMDSENFHFYNTQDDNYYTYSLIPTASKDGDITSKNLPDYCQGFSKCYYVSYYNPDLKTFSGLFSSAPSINDQRIMNGQMVQIYDSGDEDDEWNLSAYEHFRIYEILP